MRKIQLWLLLILLSLHFNILKSQDTPFDYDQQWKNIDSLRKNRLRKSVLETMDKIYQQAVETKNTPQYIKCLKQMIFDNSGFDDEHPIRVTKQIQQEIDKSTNPISTAILQSILAELYVSYYKVDSNEVNKRNYIEDGKEGNVKTWDVKTLFQKAEQLYWASVQNKEVLANEKIDKYNLILEEKTDSTNLHSTLYDLLAYRALEFYNSKYFKLVKTNLKVQYHQETYFAPVNKFKAIAFDVAHLPKKALIIYQNLLDIHPKNSMEYTYSNLNRLQYVYNHTPNSEKKIWYKTALIDFVKVSQDNEEWSMVQYKLAQFYINLSTKNKNLRQQNLEKALDCCNQAIEKYPKSYGGKNCLSLKRQLLKKSLSLETEEVNLPKTSIPILVHHKNISQVYVRVVKINPKYFWKEKSKDRNLSELMYYVLSKPIVWSKTYKVSNHYSLMPIASELFIEPQEKGFYLIIASDGEKFLPYMNKMTLTECWVTDLSFFVKERQPKSTTLKILHRKTGAPIPDARVKIMQINPDKKEYKTKFIKTLKTDANGELTVTKSMFKGDRYYFNIEIKANKDFYIPNNNLYINHRTLDKKAQLHYHNHIFTDRAVYHPGQTIYFKGIMTKNKLYEVTEIVKNNHRLKVTFLNHHQEKIKSLFYTLNDFGSFNGSFTIPPQTPTGNITIQTLYGKANVRVEACKQPKLTVKIKSSKENYKLNEKITLKGMVTALAGYGMDSVNVTYEVTRMVQYPFYRSYKEKFPEKEEVIIVDSVRTKNTGAFDISFTLKPNWSIPKEAEPIFHYIVNVKVTDQNGRTHETKHLISTGYATFIPSLHVEEKVNGNKPLAINMSVNNLQGEPMDIKGKLNIYQLQDFDRLYRKKLWKNIDTTIYDKKTYKELMPSFAFENEDQLRNLTIKKRVFKKVIKQKHLSLKTNIQNWKSGAYKAEYIVEKNGERHVSEQWFVIYRPDEEHIPLKEYAFFEILNGHVNSGENITLLLGSADKNITAYIKTEDENHTTFYKTLKINHQQQKVNIPTPKNYTGKILVSALIMKNNRVYQWNFYVNVAKDATPLVLNVAVNKTPLLPGETEEWTITTNVKESTEILASMYDASLDAIAPMPQWNIPTDEHYPYIPAPLANHIEVSNSTNFFTNYNPSHLYVKPRTFPKFELRLLYFYYFGRSEYVISCPVEIFYKGSEDDELKEIEMTMANSNMSDKKSKDSFSAYKKLLKLKSQNTQICNNSDETALFYPQLLTENGKANLKFVLPKTSTTWNFRAFGHTKELKTAFFTQSFKATKPLMIEPYMPRFIRQNDKLTFDVKVVNLSDKTQKITITLDLFDGITDNEITKDFVLGNNQKVIKIPGGQSKKVSFDIHVLSDTELLKYKLTAKTCSFSDGIEQYIPIISNVKRITKSHSFRLNQSGKTVIEIPSVEMEKVEKLTVELTGNTAWYAMQAIPYIKQKNLKSSLSTAYALYINSLTYKTLIDNSNIESTFRIWERTNTKMPKSNVNKNKILKSITLEYMPWLLEVKDKTASQRHIAQFFNYYQLEYAFNQQIKKLQQMQLSNGGWYWYQNTQANFYITQQIILLLSQINHLKVIKKEEIMPLIHKGINFSANEVWQMHQERKNKPNFDIEKYIPSSKEVLYLYALSFHPKQKLSKDIKTLNQKYIELIEKNKFNYGKMTQGYIALLFNKLNKKGIAHEITKNLKEHTILDNSGLYWPDFAAGWDWNEAPLNFQALMIQVFDEVEYDKESVEQMKLWLLNQKHTQKWETTSATAAAAYAFLSTNHKRISSRKSDIQLLIGDKEIDLKTENTEPKTGYFKKIYIKNEIKPNMKSIEIDKKDNTVSWGTVYFQCKKPMAEEEAHAHGVSIQKKYYIVDKTNNGEQLTKVSKDNPINIGDKIKVKLTLTSEHDLEFVHLQDGLAAGLEQGNNLSRYHHQDGLFYYQSMQDTSADFFIEWMRKGTYIFEYELIADKKGVFSTGIATLQSMYAPEFAAHSKGFYIEVK